MEKKETFNLKKAINKVLFTKEECYHYFFGFCSKTYGPHKEVKECICICENFKKGGKRESGEIREILHELKRVFPRPRP